MKFQFILVALISLLAVTPAFAQNEGAAHTHEDKTHQAAASPETNSTSPLQLVKKAIDDSRAALEAKELKSIHAYTDAGVAALKKISASADLTPEKKERLAAAIKQMGIRLDVLHEAADANDAAKTASELKKAEGAFKLLELHVAK